MLVRRRLPVLSDSLCTWPAKDLTHPLLVVSLDRLILSATDCHVKHRSGTETQGEGGDTEREEVWEDLIGRRESSTKGQRQNDDRASCVKWENVHDAHVVLIHGGVSHALTMLLRAPYSVCSSPAKPCHDFNTHTYLTYTSRERATETATLCSP